MASSSWQREAPSRRQYRRAAGLSAGAGRGDPGEAGDGGGANIRQPDSGEVQGLREAAELRAGNKRGGPEVSLKSSRTFSIAFSELSALQAISEKTVRLLLEAPNGSRGFEDNDKQLLDRAVAPDLGEGEVAQRVAVAGPSSVTPRPPRPGYISGLKLARQGPQDIFSLLPRALAIAIV